MLNESPFILNQIIFILFIIHEYPFKPEQTPFIWMS